MVKVYTKEKWERSIQRKNEIVIYKGTKERKINGKGAYKGKWGRCIQRKKREENKCERYIQRKNLKGLYKGKKDRKINGKGVYKGTKNFII